MNAILMDLVSAAREAIPFPSSNSFAPGPTCILKRISTLSWMRIVARPEEWMKHAESDLALAQLAKNDARILSYRSVFMHSKLLKKP